MPRAMSRRPVRISQARHAAASCLAMGIADMLGLWPPRGESELGTLGSSLPPLVALVTATF
jgi:putative membrane protein